MGSTSIMSFPALEQAWREADTLSQREHVFPISGDEEGTNVAHPENLFDSYRWTVDYEETPGWSGPS